MTDTDQRYPLSLEGIEKVLAGGGTAEDRRAYIESLRKRVAAYEQRYQMPSEILQEALASQRLREDEDVVKWVHAYETLVSLEKAADGKGAESETEPVTEDTPPQPKPKKAAKKGKSKRKAR